MGGASILGGGIFILIFLFFIAILVFWIITIVEIATSTYKDDSKTTWLLVVILVGAIGMIIYYAVGRTQRIKVQNQSWNDTDDF